MGKEQGDLELICRKNQRNKGKIPTETGKSQKNRNCKINENHLVGKKCRDFLRIYGSKA